MRVLTVIITISACVVGLVTHTSPRRPLRATETADSALQAVSTPPPTGVRVYGPYRASRNDPRRPIRIPPATTRPGEKNRPRPEKPTPPPPKVVSLPVVTCWNGKKVVDHPDVRDCLVKPQPKVTHHVVHSSGDIPAVWEALVKCEAGGDWQYGGPNGHTDPGYSEFEGGPNFLNSTWLANGGGQYAQHAYDASPYEQIVIARRVLASEGVHAWPVCGPRVGLYPGA